MKLTVIFFMKCRTLETCAICFVTLPGEMDEAVQHLSNAVAVCGQPQQLLQVFMQTLPSPVFQALLQNLPAVGQVGIPAVGHIIGGTDDIGFA